MNTPIIDNETEQALIDGHSAEEASADHPETEAPDAATVAEVEAEVHFDLVVDLMAEGPPTYRPPAGRQRPKSGPASDVTGGQVARGRAS